jgi:hypothetical protein
VKHRHGIGLSGLVGSFLLIACGGWRGHGDTYYARGIGHAEPTYAFGSPGPSWHPLDRFPGVQVAWGRRPGGGIIEIRGQCEEQGDSSLEQYLDHLRIDWTGWSVQEMAQERLQGRAALRAVVVAELDGVPRKLEFWVLKKNGCLFDLRYGAEPASFPGGLADFRRVVAAFRFPKGGA